MSNDLIPNPAPVSHTESKSVNVTASPAAPAAPAPQLSIGGNKKERFNKKSGGGFGGQQRVKL